MKNVYHAKIQFISLFVMVIPRNPHFNSLQLFRLSSAPLQALLLLLFVPALPGRRLLRSLLLVAIPIVSGCSSTDGDQRRFEQQAWNSPVSGITETDGLNSITGSEDPSDWQISPFYETLVTISPAWPNPVGTADEIQIELMVVSTGALSGMQILVLDPDGTTHTVGTTYQAPSFGPENIRLQGLELGSPPVPENARGIKRVLILDLNGNLISYGDVMVQ